MPKISGQRRRIAAFAPALPKWQARHGRFGIRSNQSVNPGDTSVMKERERALDFLARNYPGMIYHCRDDEDWSMLYVNDGALGLTGYGSDDFVSKRISYASLIDESDRDRVRSSIREAIAARRPFDLLPGSITLTGAFPLPVAPSPSNHATCRKS